MLCPFGGDELEVELLEIKRGGVETLVSLLRVNEAVMLGVDQEGPLARKIGLQFLSHPIPDGHIPPDTAAFRTFVRGLAARVRSGEHLGVHCRGSIGRSTVTAACTLIHLCWAPNVALDAIEAARGCPVPDTLEQEDWILRYEVGK